MAQIPFEPTIVAAIVSAAVALAILAIREYCIEPKRWRRTVHATNLEKRLQVYGELITILESCKRKAMRQNLNAPQPTSPEQDRSYILENPFDINNIQEIFEKSHYLLSTELLEEWYKVVRNDEFFSFADAKRKGQGTTYADLRKMQEIAESEYGKLNSEYYSLVKSEKNRNAEKKISTEMRRRIGLAEIILTVILVAAVAGLAYFLSPSGDSAFFGFTQTHVQTIKNPLDPNENMTIAINIHSATFGTGGRSVPFVSLYPNADYRNNSRNNPAPLPANYTFEIDGTYCGKRVLTDTFEGVENCDFPLTYKADIGRYDGYRENVRFSHAGDFDVLLYTKEDKTDATSVGKRFIIISDITPMIELRIFKLTTILGVVGVIIATVAIYQQHRKYH